MSRRIHHQRNWLSATLLSVSTLAFAIATPTSPATPPHQSQSTTSQSESKPIPLEPGKPLDRELQGGEKHSYEFRMQPGLFLHAVVEQLGIHVALTLYAPDARPLATMNSPNGRFGLEQISAIAELPGTYRLEVSSGNKSVPSGRYTIALAPARAPTDQDRARISAERLFIQAVRLDSRGDADSSRSAVDKYTSVLSLWRSAGDTYEEALTLHSLGSLYLSFGERQRALEFFLQALPLAQAQSVRS